MQMPIVAVFLTQSYDNVRQRTFAGIIWEKEKGDMREIRGVGMPHHGSKPVRN